MSNATTSRKIVTEALASMTTEEEFNRFFMMTVGEATRVMAAKMARGASVGTAATECHRGMMEFDPTGVAAAFVAEHTEVIVAAIMAGAGK